MTNERCINWPCAKDAGHEGPCSTSPDSRTSNYQLRAVEPPASEIEAEIMEQLAQRPHDRLCVEALALIQRLRMRAPSAADHYDCAACDQPGEHCARPHGICRRAVPPPNADLDGAADEPSPVSLSLESFQEWAGMVGGYHFRRSDAFGRAYHNDITEHAWRGWANGFAAGQRAAQPPSDVQRDAERYRWLREQDRDPKGEVCITFNVGHDWQQTSDLDYEVDDRREAQTKGESQ